MNLNLVVILSVITLFSIFILVLFKRSGSFCLKVKSKLFKNDSLYNMKIIYKIDFWNTVVSSKKSILFDKMSRSIFDTNRIALNGEQRIFLDALLKHLYTSKESKTLFIKVGSDSLDCLHVLCMKTLKDSLKATDLNFEISSNLNKLIYTYSSIELPEIVQTSLKDYLRADRVFQECLEDIQGKRD